MAGNAGTALATTNEVTLEGVDRARVGGHLVKSANRTCDLCVVSYV
jgi:hypothetical protein